MSVSCSLLIKGTRHMRSGPALITSFGLIISRKGRFSNQLLPRVLGVGGFSIITREGGHNPTDGRGHSTQNTGLPRMVPPPKCSSRCVWEYERPKDKQPSVLVHTAGQKRKRERHPLTTITETVMWECLVNQSLRRRGAGDGV